MSDEKTREMPLTGVSGVADIADAPTEPLPVHDAPAQNESAHPAGAINSDGTIDPSNQVCLGNADDDPVIRPAGPSAGTIVLGVFFCLVGLMSMLCLLPVGAWRWMSNPSMLFFYVVGGLGALLLVISVIWAVIAAVRLRRLENRSVEQSPEGQQQQR